MMAFLYLLFTEKEYVLLFVLLSVVFYLADRYRYDYFPIGIVSRQNNNTYIIDKLLYKVKIYEEGKLKVGDILYFNKPFVLSDNHNDLIKNIVFKGNAYRVIYHLRIKDLVIERISSLNKDTSSIINQLLFNIYDYDNVQYNLGYGLVTYYLLKRIRDRNRYLCISSICLFSILFSFDNKYILLLIDIFLDYFKMDKYSRISYKLIIISLINNNLLANNSFNIPILFNLYSIIDLNISFMTYLCLVESVLFGEINLITTLLFNMLVKYKIVLFILGIGVIIVPYFQNIFMFLVEIITYLNNLNFSLKGRFTILGLIIYLILIRLFSIDRKYRLILVLLIILSPLNNPFFHVTFIDIGQGDATLIKYALKRQCILIDTGSIYNYQKLKRQLDYEGIYTIDYLIISHDDSDHNGNVDRLLDDYNVRNVLYEGEDIQLNNIDLYYLYSDDYDNDNDNSLVYLVDIEGNRILFTGDISIDVEKKLVKRYNLDIDILKLAHHGSYTSNSEFFISSIMPKYGIISTSGQYGHPSSEVLNYLDRYNCKYFITKNDGNIRLYFTKLFKLFKTDKGEFVIIK